LDNGWVVPFNKYLSKRYNAHINVELCSTIAVVKYLFKYIFKGNDRAIIEIRQHGMEAMDNNVDPRPQVNEISLFLDAQFLSPPEAVWRIMDYSIHERSPAVQFLQVHLPDQHQVYFHEGELPQMENESLGKTMLTEFFVANQQLPFAGQHLYQDFPEWFVWKKDVKKWQPRQRGSTVGRMIYVHPTAGERFYLRLLLTSVRGSTSFEDLRSFEGQIHGTFKAACIARGLLEDDNEWNVCLREAATFATGSRFRSLFAMILKVCGPAQPALLWETYKEDASDDVVALERRLRRDLTLELENEERYDIALRLLDDCLIRLGSSLAAFPDMPQPRYPRTEPTANRFIKDERALAPLDVPIQEIDLLNEDQRSIFDAVCEAVQARLDGPKVFFVDGPGGTGKTFLYEKLLAYLRAGGHLMVPVASSGIAALLLKGGRTVHNRFKVPLELNDESCCNITRNSHLGEFLSQVSVVLWDEAPMSHRWVLEAVDRTLRDLTNSNHPFGNKVLVLGGDFRQILPVIKHGGREDTVAAAISRSHLWRYVTVMRLRINMRVQNGIGNAWFVDWLLEIGRGIGVEEVQGKPCIKLPPRFLWPRKNIRELTNFVYPDMTRGGEAFCSAAILTTKNADVDSLNEGILETFLGNKREYLSADSIDESTVAQHERHLLPVEMLNQLVVDGFPPHTLKLKKGAPIMLLRNLSPEEGLCNGTRLIVREMGDRVLDVEVITGFHRGSRILLPRITFISNDGELPFKLRRLQFPIKLSFAMTVNKSQGQTLSKVGLWLPDPVFSHGQLYVALSRVTSPDGVRVILGKADDSPQMENVTQNIVYPEIFQVGGSDI